MSVKSLTISKVFCLFILFGISGTGTAFSNSQAIWVDGQNIVSPFMRVYGLSLPPIGHVRFCENHPHECKQKDNSVHDRFDLTSERWQQLQQVNTKVNSKIEPITDQDLYGKLEHWTYPHELRGDCEDYVLLKRQKLIELGWPESSLLITVVLDEKGEGHAILTARTSQGDFLLDNKHQYILSWNQVPYRFIKRQSYRNPKLWVSLLPAAKHQNIAATSDTK
ncbi:MAG: transglutaminase-like cysteine peptidase [Pseudomonadota bacterium]